MTLYLNNLKITEKKYVKCLCVFSCEPGYIMLVADHLQCDEGC